MLAEVKDLNQWIDRVAERVWYRLDSPAFPTVKSVQIFIVRSMLAIADSDPQDPIYGISTGGVTVMGNPSDNSFSVYLDVGEMIFYPDEDEQRGFIKLT